MRLAVSLIVILLGLPSQVSAHANMERSTPLQDAVLKESPPEIRVQFTEAIDSKLSQITIEDQNGKIIVGKLSATDDRWLIYTIPKLNNGIYKVRWQVLSADTHVTEGSFRFSVAVPLNIEKPSETISLDMAKPSSEPSAVPNTPAPTPEIKSEIKPEIENPVISSPQPQMAAKHTPTPTQNDAQEKKEEIISGTTATITEIPIHVDIVRDSTPVIEKSPKSEEGKVTESQEKEVELESKIVNFSSYIPQPDTWRTSIYHLLRILDVLAMIGLSGALFFRFVIWDFPRKVRLDILAKGNERRIYVITFGILILSGALHDWMLADQLSGGGLKSVWNLLRTIIPSTMIGIASWIRPVLVGLMLVVTFVPKPDERRIFFMKATAAVLLIVTFPFTGHAYASVSSVWYAVLTHVLHMLAAAIWFGGLTAIFAATSNRDHTREGFTALNRLFGRFSLLALPAISIVSISGIILSFNRLKTWEVLFQSDYGKLVLAKSSILLVIIVIAGFHRLILMPQIKAMIEGNTDADAIILKRFAGGVRLEIVLVIVAFLLAGMLSTTAPPEM